jgi:hypothetical protein
MGLMLKDTDECDAWYVFATWDQTVFSGLVLPLCHQVRVVLEPLLLGGLELPPLPHAASAAMVATASVAMANLRPGVDRLLLITSSPADRIEATASKVLGTLSVFRHPRSRDNRGQPLVSMALQTSTTFP